jgi:hypothetical protein
MGRLLSKLPVRAGAEPYLLPSRAAANLDRRDAVVDGRAPWSAGPLSGPMAELTASTDDDHISSRPTGKFLLTAALFKCLDPALTIAATLNAKSPFVAPFGFEQEADRMKLSFKTGASRYLC